MESTTAAALARDLEDLISRSGPITFARFMELALYHPDHGYYTTRVPGRGVDYVTSASMGPWFGRFIARELERMWEALQRPDPFTVIEFGAGLAGLASAAIEAGGAAGAMGDALRWQIVEQFDAIADLQRAGLGDLAGRVEWRTSLDGPAVTGCVLANEVLDNFPVHLFEASGGSMQEVYVDFQDGRLVETLGPPSSRALAAQVLEGVPELADGDRFEICPGVAGWCREVGRVIERGYLFTVDYGDEEPDIWLRGPAGTLATYGTTAPGRPVSRRRGRKVGGPLRDPGLRDITADVNFTHVGREAAAAGFNFELLAHQRFWLDSLGLPDAVAEFEAEAELARALGWVEDARALSAESEQLQKLVDEDGLGGCLVYRGSKGFDAAG